MDANAFGDSGCLANLANFANSKFAQMAWAGTLLPQEGRDTAPPAIQCEQGRLGQVGQSIFATSCDCISLHPVSAVLLLCYCGITAVLLRRTFHVTAV